LTRKDSVPGEVLRNAATRALNIKLVKYGDEAEFIRADNHKIMITDSLRSSWLVDNDIDILVLTGKRPYIETNLSPQYLPRTIIISSETASSFRLPFPDRQMTDKTIWSVRKSGAYKCRL
jgi:hypothetical protein